MKKVIKWFFDLWFHGLEYKIHELEWKIEDLEKRAEKLPYELINEHEFLLKLVYRLNDLQLKRK